MKKVEFFLVILLFIYLILAIFGVGLCVYGICIVEEIWKRLVCWFGSIVCLVGTIFFIVTIKSTYFDKE